jgi:hypothetical protein
MILIGRKRRTQAALVAAEALKPITPRIARRMENAALGRHQSARETARRLKQLEKGQA